MRMVARPPEWRLKQSESGAELELQGDWIAQETGVRNADEIRRILTGAGPVARLQFDVTQLGRWDSALIVFVQMLRETIEAAPGKGPELDESGLPEPARRLLSLGRETDREQPPDDRQRAVPITVRLGQAALDKWEAGGEIATLVGETALRPAAALAGWARTRGADVLLFMREAGANALGIVAIVNGLVGAILAFVGAVQLRRFGAGIFVADLVGIATVREMAAVMTAIVMAGRTGGAYAAQIATMQGNEEIDALRALGIPVYDYLILPRVVALIAMMPLLYLYACALGLLGGLVVGMATLDLSAIAYIEQTRAAVGGEQFALGLIKSVVFGALIALVGCHIGMKAGRSAADVGRAATSAVVVGIIGIIAIDAVFAVCADALGL